jgi:hypothetical protein
VCNWMVRLGLYANLYVGSRMSDETTLILLMDDDIERSHYLDNFARVDEK